MRRLIVVVRRMPDSHPLDFPIWTALTTRQQALAQVCGGARRYPPDIAPFAALADETAQSWDALHALLAPGEPAVLSHRVRYLRRRNSTSSWPRPASR